MFHPRLALLALLTIPACAPSTEPAPARPPLPRLWTLGPAFRDLPEPKIEVVIDTEGRATIDGEVLESHALRDRLTSFADEHRDLDDPLESCRGILVVRGHPRLPWRAAQQVLLVAGDFRVRVLRVAFAVEPVGGGPEGTFALFLAIHAPVPRHAPKVEPRGHVVEIPVGKSRPARPLDLSPALSDLDEVLSDFGFLLNAWGNAPLEYVLEVCDLVHRAGVREMHVQMPPPMAMHEAPRPLSVTTGVLPSLRLDRRFIEPVPDASPRAPEVRRHPELVGFTESPPFRSFWYFHGEEPRSGPGPDMWAPLEALAALQSKDGSWGGGDVGLTGLAAVAFLECGVTHKVGKKKRNVRDALEFLKRSQGEDGDFSRESLDHALALCAFVETYARTRSPLFKQASQIALDFAVASALPPDAAAWAERARKRAIGCRLDVPRTRPARWEQGGPGGIEGRLLAALSGELPVAELEAWRERIRATPVEGRSARDLAIDLLILSAR